MRIHIYGLTAVQSLLISFVVFLQSGLAIESGIVFTEHAVDEGLPAYRIETPTAIWYLEKSGAGLSSMIDRDGKDWLNFHPKEGTRAEGEFRGIPNAVHLQAGSFFHPKNANTDSSTTRIEHLDGNRVTISATSENGLWDCRYDFFPTHCTFTMTQVPPEFEYWFLYEGTPGGAYDDDDWWMTSAIKERQALAKNHEGDIPDPEWIVFGDNHQDRVLFLLNHLDDHHPDSFYAMDKQMTVFGFGREGIEKYLSKVPRQFSFGFLDTTDHEVIKNSLEGIPEADSPANLAVSSHFPPEGRFSLHHQFQMGDEHGNSNYIEGKDLFRVNSPGASMDETFQDRNEIRFNGLMMIRTDLEVPSLAEAAVDLEVWGGHPGTFNKRMIVNGRSTYPLPEIGSKKSNCTHSYPTIPIKLSDLVNSYNAIQFACDKVAGWGHFILYDACLKLVLPANHPTLIAHGLENFSANVVASSSANNPDEIILSVRAPGEGYDQIARVDYQAFYDGYDENGDGEARDWHGFTCQGKPVAFVGSSTEAPFECAWDTSMLPAQDDISVRAIVTLSGADDLIYTTAAIHNLVVPEREGVEVHLYSPEEIPKPFWSRANSKKACEIHVPVDLQKIEKVILHLTTWGGDPGTIEDYFTVNGHAIPIASKPNPNPIRYEQLEIPATYLQQGVNRIELLSDTEEHGIEIFMPGPALMIRHSQ